MRIGRRSRRRSHVPSNVSEAVSEAVIAANSPAPIAPEIVALTSAIAVRSENLELSVS